MQLRWGTLCGRWLSCSPLASVSRKKRGRQTTHYALLLLLLLLPSRAPDVAPERERESLEKEALPSELRAGMHTAKLNCRAEMRAFVGQATKRL